MRLKKTRIEVRMIIKKTKDRRLLIKEKHITNASTL